LVSKRIGSTLTDRLWDLLNGGALDRHLNKVLMLISLDEEGRPYPAMLSFLEVVAVDRGTVRIAPWNNSTTTANLRRGSKATLLVVDEGLAYYIQASATELSRDLEGFPGMAKINLKIDSVLEDKALDYEGSARVTSGVRFENPDMDAAYIERGRKILESLRR
jgi:hypothetical protein